MQNHIAKSTHAHIHVRISLSTAAPGSIKDEEQKQVPPLNTASKLVHAKLRYADKSGTGSNTECKLQLFYKQLQYHKA